jgi:cellulose synthase/poly-beta-1,6-N-acetylglucosamine synthase-like glycosyltransferase/peptidoglycan/xylan/chitin deacetylase (PgdA/CDA1 family)/spore germination protein YaaH
MQKQIFQTEKATRWKSFVWSARILFVFLLVIISSVIISLTDKRKYDLKVLTYEEKKLPNINTDSSKFIVPAKELTDFAKHVRHFRKHHPYSYYSVKKELPGGVKKYLPVRAGFFVNWDINSSYSLQKNIGKMNMVLPEWSFVSNTKGDLTKKVDVRALNLLRKNKVAIVPMLSNFVNSRWNGDSIAIVLKNTRTRTILIKRIVDFLDHYSFQGINIDFENLPEGSETALLDFSRDLHEELQPAGYLTTIDLPVTTPQSLYGKLALYYDFMFVMAYNEYSPDGPPGSVSSLSFVENSLDAAMKEVPSNKIVLGLGAYGFDWKKGEPGQKISYQNIVALAKEHDSQLSFDFLQSDLTLRYFDNDGVEHEAHCNDAAGIFNLMRTAEDYGAGGVALWYLGSEDTRIWDFYNRSLRTDSLRARPYNFKNIENIDAISAVNYEGKGEILEIVSEPAPGKTVFEKDLNEILITGENYKSLPSPYLIKRYGANYSKKIALTFDDGPNGEYTPQILDILKEKKVPATFFVLGVNIEDNIPLIKRIYHEGHEIGNHTFTHPNVELISDDRERIELRSTRLLLESILGHSTLMFRPPYNTDAEPKNLYQMRSLAVANNENFIVVTSFIDPNDWEVDVTADSIVARAIKNDKAGNIVLLHDAGGNRRETIKALPRIIDYYRSQGYSFVTVSALMNKTRDQIMPPVDAQFSLPEKLDYIFFMITFVWEHFLHGFFFVAIVLIILRLLFIALMAVLQHRRERKQALPAVNTAFCPKVSIIVPAYNEEINAVRTVECLLKTDYSNFEIMFVDDGSKDSTYLKVHNAFAGNEKVRVLTKPNGGKAAALNFGIAHASGEIMVCIDADTVLPPDAIPRLIPYFLDEKTGAVAGNVRVGNTVNMLTHWQSIEYTTSQNFDRRAFDYVNSILVVPGAIGAFRKEALEAIDGFTTDTLAEDCDLTLRILRYGYTIRTCNEALAHTEAPESLKMFIKQRFRWSFGMMQSFWKHRDLLFSFRKPNIGWVALPNLLIFNFIIPFFSPLVDIMFVAGLFTRHALEYSLFYMLYFVIDCIISSLAYRYDQQKFGLKQMGYLFIQRFIYRQLLFFVLLKAYLRAIKGEMASWGVLKRTGNVKN